MIIMKVRINRIRLIFSISALSLVCGCTPTTPAVMPYLGTIDSDLYQLQYKTDERFVYIGIKNKSSSSMNNLLVVLKLETTSGFVETQYKAGNLASEETYIATVLAPHNFSGAILLKSYYNIEDKSRNFREFEEKIFVNF